MERLESLVDAADRYAALVTMSRWSFLDRPALVHEFIGEPVKQFRM